MLPVEQPFKTYTGLDGKPLNNGYVYFGVAGMDPITHPVTVYWDAAGTLPATQPLRTVNGYIVNDANAPANVFYDGAYSETVIDSKGRTVFYAPTSDDFSIASFVLGLAKSAGSSLIGFVQSGVGAVKMTLQDLLQESIRVSQFGARPSIPNNLTAIQAAIDAAYARGGGQVRFAAGTYAVSGSLSLPSKVELVGEGAAATIIQQNDLAAPLIKSSGFDTLTGTNNTGGIRRAAIRCMTLQGTLSGSVPAGITAQHGVAIFGYGFKVDDVQIRYFGGIGLYTEWATPGTAPDSGYFDGFTENHVAGLKTYMNGLSGIKIAGANDGQWFGPISYSNNLKDTSADKPNVWVTTKGNPQHFTQLHAWGNSSGVAMLLEGTAHLSNCAIEGATQVQVKIKTGEVTIKGGMIFAAGSTSSIGIQFVGGPTVCVGCEIDTTIENDNGGSIDFGTGIDSSKINVRAFQTSGTVMLGTTPKAGVGKSFKALFGGGANNRATIQREYSITSTNLSLTGAGDTGLEYADHGGEGILGLPQRKTEPAITYNPLSGLIAYARANAFRFHQVGAGVGSILGEPSVAIVPVDGLDVSYYQLNTLAPAGVAVTINNFSNGLVGSPFCILLPNTGAGVTIGTAGNIRTKSAGSITQGANKQLLTFMRSALDGLYYQM